MNPSFLTFALLVGWSGIASAGLRWESEDKSRNAPVGATECVESFKFTNSSDRTTKILSVSSSCGCTAATADKQAYAPNESGAIRVVFVFGDRTGEQEKSITVATDDPAQPVTVLTLKVTIPKYLELSPSFVRWDDKEALTPKRIGIKLHDGVKLSKLDAASSNPMVEAGLETVADGKNYTLVVSPKETSRPQTAIIRLLATDQVGGVKSFIAHARVR
jgi:hypothetical protein